MNDPETSTRDEVYDPRPVFGGLDAAELAELRQLAQRDPRTMEEDTDLALLAGMPRWGLYRGDDGLLPEFCGAGFCACEGRCENERDDVSAEQRAWLLRIRGRALAEQRRRLLGRLWPPRKPPRSRPVVRVAARTTPPRSRGVRRRRARAPARPDDDPEPLDAPEAAR